MPGWELGTISISSITPVQWDCWGKSTVKSRPLALMAFKIEETDVIKVECTLTYRQNSLSWCLFFLIMMMIGSMVCSVRTSDSSYTVVRHRPPLVGRGHHAGFDVNFVSHRDLLAGSGLVSHKSQNLYMNVSYPVRSTFPLPVGLNVKVMQAISVQLKIWGILIYKYIIDKITAFDLYYFI